MKVEKGFVHPLCLLWGLKPKPDFPNTHVWDANTSSKFDFPFEMISIVLVEPSGVQALKNPNPLKAVEG